MVKLLSRILLGKSQDPLAPESRSNIALIAFLAWVGLGADGLSSSCYGPELGYNALSHYHHLALYLAVLTCITIFIIAMSYNQVIEQILTSKRCWIFQNNQYLPVIPQDQNVTFKTSLNDRLANYTMTFKYAFDKINTIR